MNDSVLQSAKVDRSQFCVTQIHSRDNDYAWWITQPPLKRLEALEFMRQVMFSYAPDTARLQGFFEIAERAPR